jgi:hypothetical protein
MTASPYEDNPLPSHGMLHVRRDAAPRVHFLSPDGRSLCIVDAPLSDWLVFLQSVGYSVADYSESDIVPHLKRCDVINSLVREGLLKVNTDASMYPWRPPLMLLEPVRVVVGCAELAKEGRWDTALCCGDCHASGDFISVVLRDRREARVCCVAEKLLGDYGTGKSYTHLPSHED